MEIKSVNIILKETQEAINSDNYEEAYNIAKEHIDLNKEYIEGEYVFKNLLEELLFQVHIKKEITRKYPLILDYSELYTIYGEILLKYQRFSEAQKSFKLGINYNPTNVRALFGLSEIIKIHENWEEYEKIILETFKYDYTPQNLAKSFRKLAIYYFNKYNQDKSNNSNKSNSDNSENSENLKIGSYLTILSKEYDNNSKIAIEELEHLENLIDEEFKDTNINEINEIKDYLNTKDLPYGPAIEIITICKSLGFQLDESKKVVPALHYFKIAYDLTKDENIKLTIDDLNEKIERRLNE